MRILSVNKKRPLGGVSFYFDNRIAGIGLVLLVLSWLAPDHYPPWYSFHSELLTFVATALLVVGALATSGRYITLPRLTLWVLGAACIAWMQWATGVSFFAGDALVVTLYLVGFVGAIWFGYNAFTVPNGPALQPLMGLTQALWIGAIVSAVIGLLQWLALQDFVSSVTVFGGDGSRAIGNLGQPNHLATLLLMGIVALTYTFERRVIGSVAFGSGTVFLSLVLLQTQSRTGLLSAMAIAAFFLLHQRERASRLKSVPVMAWALGLMAGHLLLPWVHDLMLLTPVRGTGMADSNGRALMWQQVAYGVWESPWLGYGWNQTPTAHSVGALALPGELSINYAHNFMLDMMAWNGIPAGLLLSGACLYWLVSRAWQSRSIHGWHAMACLVPFSIHSMLEFPFPYAYFLLPAGIMVGVVEATRSDSRPFQVNARWLWGILGVWMIFGSAVVWEYLLVEEDFRIVRFENLRVGSTPASYQAPEIHLLTHMGAMLKQARVEARPGMSPSELDSLRKVALRFPYAAMSFRYAVALGLNGDSAGATRQMAIVRGVYGKLYYRQVIDSLRQLEQEKYPQLNAVLTP